MMGRQYDYVIVDDDDFPPETARMLQQAADEAERGYSLEFLRKCKRGRPLKIGATPARHKVQVRLDEVRLKRLNDYASEHRLSQSEAMRELMDKGLSAA